MYPSAGPRLVSYTGGSFITSQVEVEWKLRLLGLRRSIRPGKARPLHIAYQPL